MDRRDIKIENLNNKEKAISWKWLFLLQYSYEKINLSFPF